MQPISMIIINWNPSYEKLMHCPCVCGLRFKQITNNKYIDVVDTLLQAFNQQLNTVIGIVWHKKFTFNFNLKNSFVKLFDLMVKHEDMSVVFFAQYCFYILSSPLFLPF